MRDLEGYTHLFWDETNVIESLETIKAILEGIKSIFDTCKRNFILLDIESDALEVVNILNGNFEDLTELKNFTKTIYSLSSSLESVSFSHCRREVNIEAHRVATEACKFYFFENWGTSPSREGGCIFWFLDIPSSY